MAKTMSLWFTTADGRKILLLRGDVIDETLDGLSYHVALHHPWNYQFDIDKMWVSKSSANTMLEFKD